MAPILVFLLTLLLGLWPLACQSQVTVSGSGSTKVVPNDPTTGTVAAGLAKIGPTGAIRTTPSDTNTPIWIVVGGAGINPNIPAVLAVTGDVPCTFDTTASNVRGQLVVPSATANAQCHATATPPSTGYAVGVMADNSTTAGQTALVSAQLINYQAGSGTGTGSVTSVGFTPPSLFTVSGQPVIAAGTIVESWQTQAANCVVAGPASGAAAQPTCRPLALADLPAGTASGACGGDLGGTFPNCTVTQASGQFALAGDVSVTLSGSVGDYTGCTGSVCRMNGQGNDVLVTGIDPGAAKDGRIVPICNVGPTNKITLVDEPNVTTPPSSAANKFQFGANVTLRPKTCKPLIYDNNAGTLRWRLLDSALLDPYKFKSCTIPFGSTDTSAPPLSSTDDVPAACGNNTGFDWAITGVKVYANAGTPSFFPSLTGGTTTSLLTGTCTAAAGVWTACSLQTTPAPVVHSFSGAGSATCAVPPCTVEGLQDVPGGTATFGLIELSGPLQ